MSQRDSGYERRERDLYETPAWVTDALIPHLPDWRTCELYNPEIWEPAAGGGKMAVALRAHGFEVRESDIATGMDFLQVINPPCDLDAIITNPPYALATEFIEHAIDMARPSKGLVAMLLRTDFDHAKTRQHLFSKCSVFAKKIVLTRRIVWFEGPGASPSFNHAWYIWDHGNPPVAPTLAYAA
jgi:hypothetical protein